MKKILAITVLRTLFYQFFLLFVGLSIGFILNAEWCGIKGLLIKKSVDKIFFPIEYNEQMERWVKGWGAYKVYASKNYPDGFEIIDENIYHNEEWYWCRFKYVDKDKNIKFDEGTARVRWKTWEQYYEHEVLDTPEKIIERIEKDKKEIENRKKEIERSRVIEKEMLDASKK